MSERKETSTEARLREDKERKLAELREAGIEPYPFRYERTAMAAECIEGGEAWIESERPLALAGRLMSQRVMGKSSFGHLEDRSGRIQLFIRLDELGEESYRQFKKLIDVGDHIGVQGVLFTTRSGELSLRVSELTLLSKAMIALPEKYHGLQDPELRSRQRYMDLVANPDVRRSFERRSQILRIVRGFFDSHGFNEVETPVLQPLYGGASARPFVTQHNALDRTLFLRIADELYLKRLIVGGMERVYEVGKIFRNEGMDRSHNPEFTMLEAYAAYWDYTDLMTFFEELYAHLLTELGIGMTLTYGEMEIDFTPPWPRLPYMEAIEKYAGEDVRGWDAGRLAAFVESKGISVAPEWGMGKLLDALMSEFVEPHLVNPTFLTDYPKEISPLAKDHRSESGLVERFELFIAGMEAANVFSELNDPAEQRLRFEAQMGLKAGGDEEAQVLDEDYLCALELGMPPTAGLGLGIDRLVMLLNNSNHIRDVLLFPMLRSEA